MFCRLLTDGDPPRALPSAGVVLRCVHEQWKGLQVWQLPFGTITRVVGKQTDQYGKPLYDDVWMAFSIGLQWCTRFTRLLATDEDRVRLVQHMRNMRSTLHRALRQSLDTMPLTGRGTETEGSGEDVAPVRTNWERPIVHAVMPNAEDMDSLVGIGAVVMATLHGATRLGVILRRLVFRVPLVNISDNGVLVAAVRAATGEVGDGSYVVKASQRAVYASMLCGHVASWRKVQDPSQRRIWQETGPSRSAMERL